MHKKINELMHEFRMVFSGRMNTLDVVVPPLLYAFVYRLVGLLPAALASLILASGITISRLVRKQSWYYALSGLLLTAIAVGLALFTQNAANYYLPDLISSSGLLLIALISIWVKKPLAAWSSHLTRSWPREWYWLPTIRPAYIEVTWMWAGIIAARLAAQYILYRQANISILVLADLLLGWPVTISVLVMSYLYGIWRLAKLGGPSVEEYKSNQPPPWMGQKRGF